MDVQPMDEIDDVVSRLCNLDTIRHVCPQRQGLGAPLLSNGAVYRIVRLAGGLIFPGFYDEQEVSASELQSRMTLDCHELKRLLVHQISAALCFSDTDCRRSIADISSAAKDHASAFVAKLPALRRVLDSDVDATYAGDPAAISVQEVIMCYPGLRATMSYRIAHVLVELGVPILPRMITEQAHSDTGIDIHPEATIGHSFVIDHGTGVVIGATSVIGDNVKIYQGVTLGARSFVRDADNNPVKGLPRHPILGNNVVVYANSTILGRITIGDGAVIGGNLWVTRPVEPGERLVQANPENFRSV